MSNSLYQIQQEYLQLVSKLEELEYLSVEEQEQVEESIKINAEQFMTKAQGYLYIMDQLQSEKEYAEREIERIKRFATEKEKARDALKAALLQALLLYGEQDGEVYRKQIGNIRLSTRKSKRVDINDPERLPDECFTYEIKLKSLSKVDANRIAETLRVIDAQYQVDESISKTKIKEAIEKAEAEERGFDGATMETVYHLVIK